MPAAPSVFTIPPGVPFLPTLADELLAGRFGLVGDPRDDPLALADVTILLPTRRSARALRDVFLQRAGGEAAILPRIRPIGDVDEEEHILAAPAEDAADRLMLPPAVSRLERLLTLAGLILEWGRTVRRERLRLDPDEPLLIPASPSDAAGLAADLGRLMDEMASAGLDWSRLESLTPADYPGYWQLTLDFLRIATEAWPAHLSERGLADPIARRDQLIRAEAERLAAAPPRGPVIAAGSTGSIPATAALLATIARLPTGAVILPGLDQGTDAATWRAIGSLSDEPAGFGIAPAGAPSHPQFGLRQLVAALGVERDEVTPLGRPAAAMLDRSRWVSEALRPAETTDAWAAAPAPPEDATDGVEFLFARNEQEEALAIAIALRESLETPNQTAALVTPDRTLARRVAAELRRWQLEVDDSAGRPLAATAPAVFARLLAEAAVAKGDPLRLLALLKHPFASFGLGRGRCRRGARILEVAALRGARLAGGVAALPQQLVDIRYELDMKGDRFAPRVRRRLGKKDWELADDLARRVAAVLGPLEAAADGRALTAGELTGLLATALDGAAEDARAETSLWDEAGGQQLAELLAGLLGSDLALTAAEYPPFLHAAMQGIVVTPHPAVDPRIHIWGALEARLQSVDLIILGALDEGVWPGETRTDPWLSRRMRSAIGLPPPERRIGLAAHDFAAAMGAPRVILSRAEKRGGAPTVMSRWLQRLTAITGKARSDALTALGNRYLTLARRIDRVPASEVRPALRPEPRPRAEVRPRRLSISDIERLIRDPYSIYARKILDLEALEEIGRPADARTRGNLIHDALANFTKTWGGPFDETARAFLLKGWSETFEPLKPFPEIHAIWWIRSEEIARWMVDWEAERDAGIASRHAEISGRMTFETPGGAFTLVGRADRIDLLRDGTVAIYDYKTGQVPTAKQVLLFSPQLALEAAMTAGGHFGDMFRDRPVSELAWIGLARLSTRAVESAADKGWTPDTVGAEALRRLKAMIAAYDNPARPYVSQARPMFERRFPGDYDHLARVAEWRLAASEGE